MHITASILYDYIQCPHKVWRDVWGPMSEKIDETNPFVEMLWKKGVQHEEKMVGRLGEYLDLGTGSLDERWDKTLVAMNAGVALIYQGVIQYENMLGIPDLLKRQPDGSYIAIDIKSGMALEGADEESGDEGKPKKHYAVQLCLYTDVLRKMGFADHRLAKIIDIHGGETIYELDSPMGPKTPQTWWEYYEEVKDIVSGLLLNNTQNKPAMMTDCKICPWYKSCKKWCDDTNDLSNVFYLGRSVRDRLNEDIDIERIDELAELDAEMVIKQKEAAIKAGDKKFLERIGKDSLTKLIKRARILTTSKQPVAYDKIDFPDVTYELFFDIEDDPTQEFVYLHGVYERTPSSERFLDFTARDMSHEAEEKAWGEFWEYIRSLPVDDFAVYYFSPHEKSTYRRMQKKFPDVISSEELEAFFGHDHVIDLYKIVLSSTDWPLGSYSLKAIAVYLGFKWRDETPSGALSIQWFNEYIEKQDPKLLERILLYNEDDCKATMVLKDALEKMGR